MITLNLEGEIGGERRGYFCWITATTDPFEKGFGDGNILLLAHHFLLNQSADIRPALTTISSNPVIRRIEPG